MRLLSVSLIAALMLWGVTPASAQRRAHISRPSERTGSQVLGLIGGTFTRSKSEPQSLRGTPSSPQFGATSPLAVPGMSQRHGTGFYAGALSVGSATIAPPRSPGVYQIGMTQIEQSRRLSALDYASDPRASFHQIQALNRLPGLTTPVYVRQAGGSAFHRIFGLTPADQAVRKEEDKAAFPSDLTQADIMQANLDAREKLIVDDALAAFTRAMDDRPLVDRLPDLKDAEARLQTAVELHPAEMNADLNLCLLHISLELEQIGMASSLIDAAIRANPRLFLDRFTVAKRMGDYNAERDYSRRLEDHFRRYVATASYNPNSVDAQILTGYCAVYLKDWRRLQDAVTMISEGILSTEQREPLDRFLWAVNPVLEQRP